MSRDFGGPTPTEMGLVPEIQKNFQGTVKKSTDGKHYITLEVKDGMAIIGVDGKQHVKTPAELKHEGMSAEQAILEVAISKNGEHNGFIRKTQDGDYLIYLDGRPAFTFKQEFSQFTPDNGLTTDDSKPNWQNFHLLSVSDDGKHWACIGRDTDAGREENAKRWGASPKRGWSVILDGEVVTRPIQTLGAVELSLSSDGKRFRFAGGVDYPDEENGVIFYGTKKEVKEKIEK